MSEETPKQIKLFNVIEYVRGILTNVSKRLIILEKTVDNLKEDYVRRQHELEMQMRVIEGNQQDHLRELQKIQLQITSIENQFLEKKQKGMLL